MLLSIDVSSQDSSATVSPIGEIDLATVGLLSDTLRDVVEAGARHVTVDLGHTTYIDSAGLGALVGAHKRLRTHGGTLVLRCDQPSVLKLFTITGLTKLFTIEPAASHAADPDPVVDTVAG